MGRPYDHPEGRTLWNIRVRRSFQDSPAFRALLASQARLGKLQSQEGGLVLRNVPLLEVDRPRIERIIRKVVLGLYWHHRQSILPSDTPFIIRVETLNLAHELRASQEIWSGLRAYRLGSGNLDYRFGVYSEHPTVSLSWLLFFSGVLFEVITGDITGLSSGVE
jgi:hypothetical protein